MGVGGWPTGSSHGSVRPVHLLRVVLSIMIMMISIIVIIIVSIIHYDCY